MSATTAVQLKDGAGNYLQAQYYDPASDSYLAGTPDSAPIGTVSTPLIAATLVLKAGPCNLYGLNVCATSTAGFLMLFNAASVPVDGIVTPTKVWPVAANAALEIGFSQPIRMPLGACIAFSSTGPLLLTRSALAFMSGEVM